MKYLFMVCAMFALLAIGCGEDVAVQEIQKVEVTEVDKDALASALAANELTLVDFTAIW